MQCLNVVNKVEIEAKESDLGHMSKHLSVCNSNVHDLNGNCKPCITKHHFLYRGQFIVDLLSFVCQNVVRFSYAFHSSINFALNKSSFLELLQKCYKNARQF